ncbi:transcriptional regulator [Brevibacterium sediminis]|uniref:Transcriptional regulator n=1 Tax=Brevibacterium sediminis TaxID=1857024 RepID=A0ABQ1MNP0_9MICO|nr:GntR family transcriptional regulator [Brevibacterium sediminis]GGC43556.1 transcriptional regulator [Brevibacterium sediminis]
MSDLEHQSPVGGRLAKTDVVYRDLREAIESGELVPGQSLPEAYIVERTGASRTPVREALRRLAAEQLVEIAPRRAPVVSRLSLRQARAIFEYRRLLEPAAIKLIVGRLADEPGLTARFKALREQFAELVGRPYSTEFAEEFAKLAKAFDELVIELTPNEFLARGIVDLRPQARRLRRMAHADIARLQESVREHIDMCAAIVDKDAERAMSACQQHLFHVDRAIFDALLKSTAGRGADVDIAP